MNLLLDIGNTRIKWVQAGTEDWRPGTPLPHKGKAFKDVARPAWKELDTPERVIVSCVLGADYEKSVRTWVKRRWKVDPEFLHPEAECGGVRNAYRDPERLGVDRWAGLLAAHANYPGPAVIIDCGSAVTVDALDAEGMHLGGLIIPGMEMMAATLSDNTAGISLAENDADDVSVLGRTTEAAVTGGILYAMVSFADRVIHDLRAELGSSVNLIITGGDAERVRPLLASRVTHDPDLVLKGLKVFAETAE